jgi:hypothetical protein
MKKNHDIIEISCQRIHETSLAVLVVNLKNKEIWLPKSQVEIEEELNTAEDIILIQIPEWLAEEKELI